MRIRITHQRITVTLQLILLAEAVFAIWGQRWFTAFLTAMIIAITFLPLLFERRFRIHIPPELQLAAIGFVFAQAVVDRFAGRIQFVQVGETDHHHPALNGVIDFRGKTTLRELVRLMHRAQGVVCPVTLLMHLAAAVDTLPARPPNRPCVVIAGGREPPHWEAYPFHQFHHTVGMLDLRWNHGSTALVSSRYGYDRNSNQRWRKDVAAAAASVNTEDQMFWYDGLQQVYQRQRGTLTPTTPPYTGITGLQQTEAFSFDETGNWLTDYNSTGGPLNQSRTHNKANEIASLSGPTGVVQPVYSAVGNSTTVPQPDNWAAAHTLKWDAWNRLVEVPTAGTVYQYDALFRRVRILAGGADHHYSFTDQWQVSEASYAGGSLIWRAFWGLRDLNDIIKRDGVSSHGTCLYGLRDKLNFVAVTDASGTVNLRIAYDAFGKARYLTSAFAAGSNTYYWNFLFHGYEWDAQSGFLAVRFRTYHPTLGRWLSRDPIGEEGGLNLYAAFSNNSFDGIDVLGLRKMRPDTDPGPWEDTGAPWPIPSASSSLQCEAPCDCTLEIDMQVIGRRRFRPGDPGMSINRNDFEGCFEIRFKTVLNCPGKPPEKSTWSQNLGCWKGMFINNQPTIGTPMGKILDAASCEDYNKGDIGKSVEEHLDSVFDAPENAIIPGGQTGSPTMPRR